VRKPRCASPSSAHTYRLLVFKEHSQNPPEPVSRRSTGALPFCVAASAAEKRDYEQRFAIRQQVF
ncbi:hypothetical protein, partial [Caballeronia choica]|uniref:hypothetical protein n=1 Tax=Caballeronia choica TaxID=326476 RepID=UPI001F1BE97F